MKVTFEADRYGELHPAVGPADTEAQQTYCRLYVEMAARMVDGELSMTVPLLWDVPDEFPCGCLRADCERCRDDILVPSTRVFYEQWEHPDLIKAASEAYGIKLGTGDTVMLVPLRAVTTTDVVEIACHVARDLSEIALVRWKMYEGNLPMLHVQRVHHAAACLLVRVCRRDPFLMGEPGMEAVRDTLIDWTVRHLATPYESRPDHEIAFIEDHEFLVEDLHAAWAAAIDDASPMPMAPHTIHEEALAIVSRLDARFETRTQAA